MIVHFAIPAYRGIQCHAMLDSLEATLKACEARGHTAHMAMATGNCYIQTARNNLVKQFMDSEADTLFFLDDDVSWTPEDALRMIEMPDEIVAGVYPYKTEKEDYPVVIDTDSNYFPITRKDGCIKGSLVATGFLRIKRSAIEQLISKYPQSKYSNYKDNQWAEDVYDLFPQGVKNGRWVGEDFAFCQLWNAIGGEIWIVPDMTITHHNGKASFAGNYHEYLTRQPGGINSSEAVRKEYPETGIPGWTSAVELQWLHERAQVMTSVAEIGSFAGRSIHALASAGPGTVYAIDTWKGTDGDTSKEYYKQIDIQAHFKRHTAGFKNLQEMEMDSNTAAERIDAVDMVFIDAAHDYESVLNDIKTWLPKTRKLICGHDYDITLWPGVVRAAVEVFGSRIKIFETIWYVEIEGGSK